jgi:hypothetical protein
MTWDKWVSDNYQFLELWARRWSPNDWADLISHYCEWLNKNWDKFSKIPDGEERLKWTQTWMKNMVKWKNSDFNKIMRIMASDLEPSEEAYDDLLEVKSETSREDITEWLVDLHETFTEDQIKKIVRLRGVYVMLMTHEKVMWDLYFTNMMSMRQISAKLNIPLSSIHMMILELKEKIIKGYGDFN